jgi:hypothetical protein
MKKYLFQSACLLSLFFLVSCGGTEDTPAPIDPDTDPFLRIESFVEQLENLEIGVPKNWEKTRDPVERAAYARYLISVGRIPVSLDLNDVYTPDPVVQAEYYRAQLIKRFGDIPEVHTFADNGLRNALGIYPTDEEINAAEKAYAFLFPDQFSKIKPTHNERISAELEELARIRKEYPEAWIEHNLARLIKEHGDTRDVRTVADFMGKIELGQTITEAEYETYVEIMDRLSPRIRTIDEVYVRLEAESQLGIWLSDIKQCRLKAYRWAREEGISFVQIDWINLDEEHEFCQKNGS